MKLRTFALAASVAFVATASHAQPKAPTGTGAVKPAAPAPIAPTASAAAAAPSPAPPAVPSLSEALSGQAKQEYESGKLLFGDGDHVGALAKFGSAYAHSRDPRLLWNMAACEKNLRHYAKALGLVRRYVDEGEPVLSPQDKIDGLELVKVMEPFTAKLRITVDQPGAEVLLDEELLGRSPLAPVLVDMGVRKLRVRKDGFEELARELPVGGATELTTEVKLSKIVHEGHLAVQAPSGATISIDGKVVGNGAWAGVVASGGHSLRVVAPQMRPYQSEVLILDKQTREVAVTLEAEPSKGLPGWVWVAGGLVVAGGLATAGYFIFKPSGAYQGPQGNLDPGVVQTNAPFHFR